jgi:hypothetical protein
MLACRKNQELRLAPGVTVLTSSRTTCDFRMPPVGISFSNDSRPMQALAMMPTKVAPGKRRKSEIFGHSVIPAPWLVSRRAHGSHIDQDGLIPADFDCIAEFVVTVIENNI